MRRMTLSPKFNLLKKMVFDAPGVSPVLQERV